MFNYNNSTPSPSTFSHSTPEEILELGIDKIRTAFSQRVRALENEVNELNFVLKERDNKLMEANNVIKRLETELNDQTMKMRILQEEKSKAQQETYEVTQTVRKLRVDVSKLQAFKKSIIDSFDGDDIVKTGNLMETIISSPTHSNTPLSSTSFQRNFSPYRSLSPIQPDTTKPTTSPSQNTFIRSDSPAQSPHLSNRVISPSPLTTSQLNSQHNHNLQSSNTKSPQLFTRTPSPTPNSIHNNASFNNSATTQPITTPNNNNQLEGKEFFKQARQRLDYDKFNELISGIKKLNGHIITTDQCLETAWDIFGDQNTDLYYSFKKMLIK